MVTKNRTTQNLEVDSKKPSFTYNKGEYVLLKEAVNFYYNPQNQKLVYPELIYIEGQPTPVNSENKDSTKFLNKVVLQNALQQVSDQKSEWASIIGEYARSPSKIVMLVFALIILISFLGGLAG